MSWPLQLCPAALCHDTIHCIVTQMGNSPSSLCNFFFHPFFFHSNYWKTTKKKIFIYFFHFPVEPNKFIKIFFKFCFPVLHIVKPQKKKKISSHHFFFLRAIHQAHKPYNSQHMITQFIHNIHQNAHHSSKCRVYA